MARIHNPQTPIVILTDRAHRSEVQAAGLRFADLDSHRETYTAATEGYQQLTPTDGTGGGVEYARFCWLRWRWLAAELAQRKLPPAAVFVTIESDLLLYEDVNARLAEMRRDRSQFEAFSLINGAYVVATHRALAAFAHFQRWIARGASVTADNAAEDASAAEERAAVLSARAALLRFGEPMAPMHSQRRSSRWMTPVRDANGSDVLVRFNDMSAFNAHKLLSRTDALPPAMRVAWHAGFHRATCLEVNQIHKVELTGWRAAAPLVRVRSSDCAGPACYLHMQGPQAKRQHLSAAIERSLQRTLPGLQERPAELSNLSCPAAEATAALLRHSAAPIGRSGEGEARL